MCRPSRISVHSIFFLLIISSASVKGNMLTCPGVNGYWGDTVLKVGMKAPQLIVKSWRNGEQIGKFQNGRYYVVEFTSILCGPCKKAVPRLQRLQQRFGDSASVIGVYGDRDEHIKYIDSMIKKMKLSYSVASADTYPYPVSATWLKGDSAREKNLMTGNFRPFCTTFVIDKQGTVVWIGNALDEPFERIVEAIFSGTYHDRIYTDYLKSKEQLIREYMETVNNVGSHPEHVLPMLNKLDSLIIKDPEEGNYRSFKVNLLLKYDERAAFSYIRELMNTTYKEEGSDNLQLVLSYILAGLANEYKPFHPYPGLRTLKMNDYDLLIDLARHNRAISDEKYATMNMSVEALGYFLKGDKKKAIKMQKNLIRVKKENGLGSIEEDERALEYYLHN